MYLSVFYVWIECACSSLLYHAQENKKKEKITKVHFYCFKIVISELKVHLNARGYIENGEKMCANEFF